MCSGVYIYFEFWERMHELRELVNILLAMCANSIDVCQMIQCVQRFLILVCLVRNIEKKDMHETKWKIIPDSTQ